MTGIDTTRPNSARVWNYLGGGSANYAADRDLGRQLEQLCPLVSEIPADSRAFLGRAVRWAGTQGVAQFLDLGSGLLANPAVHEIARDAVQDARVAYVDHDEAVILRWRARAEGKGIAAVEADLTDPAGVLGHQAVAALIDLDEPVCVLACMVLHYLDAEAARTMVSGYAGKLAPGSVIVVSVPRCTDAPLLSRLRETYSLAEVHNHAPAAVASFLAGLELEPPGVTLARRWRPGWPAAHLSPGGPVYAIGAVARKP